MAWRGAGEGQRALEEVDRLLGATPRDAHLHLLRSQLLGDGDPQGSLEAADRAVALAGGEPVLLGAALRQRAHARWRAGDQPGAWQDVEALEELPGLGDMAQRVRAEVEALARASGGR